MLNFLNENVKEEILPGWNNNFSVENYFGENQNYLNNNINIKNENQSFQRMDYDVSSLFHLKNESNRVEFLSGTKFNNN